MRFPIGRIALVALLLVAASCTDRELLGPSSPTPARPSLVALAPMPEVRFSEIHYDNTGADQGEAIEISGPVGTDLTGWRIVLYNGNGGAPYAPLKTLSGSIPATCGARGVMVVQYDPAAGIQNGAPDGMALVDANNDLVEFLSYEGAFTGVGDAADKVVSKNIGGIESGNDPIGHTLQRTAWGGFSNPLPNTLGACNDEDPAPAIASVTISPTSGAVLAGGSLQFSALAFDPASQLVSGVAFNWSSSDNTIATVDVNGRVTGVLPGTATITVAAPNGISASASLAVGPPAGVPLTRFSEIHYDNASTDVGEAIEIEGPAGTDLTNWSVVLYNGSNGLAYDTRALSGTIPDQCNGRGTISITYASNGIQNGSPDGLALINATGGVEEFLSYEGTMTALGPPATGAISSDIIVSQSGSDPIGESLQRDALGKWHSPRTSSFGACNVIVTTPVNPITFTGRTLGDPALPVGFQDQLFATLRDPSGNVVSTTFTWLSETPAIATIDQNGVMTAVGAGQAIIRATAVTGATSTVTLPTRIATASATAQYGFNTEFGVPADADNSDDFLVTYPQFTTSFNKNRGTPNWVSYNLDATHFGPEDRCDCFTFDPNLPGEFQRYTTADYTGAGTFHGYGIDRGHFARSFDRTAGSLDNAHTYYFTNIVPQAADNNQGPWAAMENALGDLARFSDKELFIIAGVAGSKGTVKDEGKIVIPAKVWKVALILPRDQGLASVDDPSDVQVVAVIMPNDPGIRNVNWETYKTTVDAVEALSGYDVFALLPNPIETAVESGTSAPTAATDGPYTGLEGSSLPMSGAGSSDPDVGQTLIYSWDFGDGSTGTGATTSHTFTQDGSYTVTLTVTDPLGLSSVATATATVFNVTPSIAAFAGATLLPGETYAASGSFTDPGSDSWSATVDYGDGSGQSALSLNGKSFSLSHTYGAAGTFTVTVNVSDDDATSTGTQTVVVLSASQAVSQLRGMVNQLLQGDLITPGVATSLDTKLRNALKSLERGNTAEAITQLTEFLTELNSLVSSRRLTSAQADPLRILVQRVLQSIGG